MNAFIPYFLYHLRWQASALLMMPVMLMLDHVGIPLWANLPVGQFFGALVFWKIDDALFKFKSSVCEEEK